MLCTPRGEKRPPRGKARGNQGPTRWRLHIVISPPRGGRTYVSNRTYGERRIRVGFRAAKGELKSFMLIDTRISLDSNPTKYQQSKECSEHTKPRICGTSARAPPGHPRTLRSALRALPCPESPVPPAARAASS